MLCSQFSICGETREGVSNVFLTKLVGVNENLGVEGTRGGLNQPPRQIEPCV